MSLYFPDAVRKIGIAAPASGMTRLRLKRVRDFFAKQGIEVVCPDNTLTPSPLPWVAAPEEIRLANLNALIRDPSVRLILALRGGTGTAAILDGIDWTAFRERKKLILAGYSDITSLHCAMLRNHAGIPVVSRMAEALMRSTGSPAIVRDVRRTMELALAETPVLQKRKRLRVLRGGCAEGPLLPMNLTVLASLCGTPYFPEMRGAVLALEDVGELPYRIDRTLRQLYGCGVFDSVSAVIFGKFTDCGKAGEMTALKHYWAEKIGKPVFDGLCFGHTEDSLSFVCGERVTLHSDGTLYY